VRFKTGTTIVCLVLDSQGRIYGTAFHGGVHGYGNAFEITP